MTDLIIGLKLLKQALFEYMSEIMENSEIQISLDFNLSKTMFCN